MLIPNLAIRALWYLLVGWWLTGTLMIVAWLAGLIIVGLPLTFYLVNRLPTFLTLRPRSHFMVAMTDASGATTYRRLATDQYSGVVRAIYFILVGWWLSALWMIGAYLLFLTVIGIPIGLMLVNRVPFVYSLHRGYA